MNRISAFTIIELIVAILIGSLLVVFIWSGYSFVQKQYLKWNKENQLIGEIVIFDRQLKRDIKRAEVIRNNGDKLILTKAGSVTEYYFKEDLIIRKEINRTDSIRCKVFKYECTYLQDDWNKDRVIRFIDISIETRGGNLTLAYCKEYDSKLIYNLNKR